MITPLQLPSEPPGFVGRVKELAALDRTLTALEGTVTRNGRAGATAMITLISGTAGIGKTWCALTWANRNQHRFPAGHLYADLRGFSPGSPLDPTDVLAGFLRALGMTEGQIPPRLADRAGMYRSLVAQRRMLIMLDNAAELAQLEPLLPGGHTCRVLITSRTKLSALITRYGAQHINLNPLTTHESHALLTARLDPERMSAEPDAVTGIVEMCQGFSLALGLITGRAQIQQHLPLGRLLAELRALGLDVLDDDPTNGLSTVLSWSYQALTPDQQGLFMWLGLMDIQHITIPATAASGLHPDEAQRALRALERASLVTPNAACGHHTMHDLVRAYAGKVARPGLGADARTVATRRIISVYARIAEIGNRAVPAELAHCRIPPLAATDHQTPPLASTLGITKLEDLIGDSRTVDDARLAAPGLGMDQEGWRVTWLADALSSRYDVRTDAVACWLDGLARIHEVAGGIYAYSHHDYRRALTHFTCARDLRKALNDTWQQAQAHREMSYCATRVGNHDQARKWCHTALAGFHGSEHRSAYMEAETLAVLGEVEHRTTNYELAVRYYLEALALYGHEPEAGSRRIASTLCRLGHCYMTLGTPDQARDAWTRALESSCDHLTPHLQQQLAKLDHA